MTGEVEQMYGVFKLLEEYKRRREKESLIRELGEELIDAGYRLMAMKVHPDKGGSTEKMANLSKAREFLKDAIFPLGRTSDEVRRIKARERRRKRPVKNPDNEGIDNDA